MINIECICIEIPTEMLIYFMNKEPKMKHME